MFVFLIFNFWLSLSLFLGQNLWLRTDAKKSATSAKVRVRKCWVVEHFIHIFSVESALPGLHTEQLSNHAN